MAILTISRQLGSGGNAIASQLVQRLGYKLVDKVKLHEMVTDYGQFKTELEKVINEEKPRFLDRFFHSQKIYFDLLQTLIYDVACLGNVIIMGRGGHIILKDVPGVLRVKVISPQGLRVKRVMEDQGVSRENAEELVRQNDRERGGFMRYLFDIDEADPHFYDLVINTGRLSLSTAVDFIAEAVTSSELQTAASESLETLKRLALVKKVERTLSQVVSGSSYVAVQAASTSGTITLEGVVRSEEEKRKVEEKVLSVPGIKEVINELKVTQIPSQDTLPNM
ncbi:MAG: cytidylate kinase-like family protein [Nitrospira sp.]|nr:cytidylate kinase-like family protein [Nitrospira sp.]